MKLFRNLKIRTRILVYFSAAFLVLLFLLLAVMGLFMEDYYIRTNEVTLKNHMRALAKHKDPDIIMNQSTYVQGRTGGNIEIYDSQNRVLGYRPSPTNRPIVEPVEVDAYRNLAMEAGPDGYFVLDEGEQDTRLLVAIMSGDFLLIAVKPLGVVREASSMFYAFMIRAALAVYLVGVVLVFVISRYLTKPVTKMKDITKQMSELNFDEHLDVRSNDEIGQLMNSVNIMADKLSETIKTLNLTNEELEFELQREKSLERMRRRFVSDVSHELKNPLAMIVGYADGLMHNIPKTDEARNEYYEIIVDEANRMTKLVKDLLDLSAYESGTYKLQVEEVNVNELMDNSIERFNHMYEEKDVKIQYDKEEEVYLKGDRLRISQVIINLISNAFKHVDHEGTIMIDFAHEGDQTKIAIKNTGNLIPENELDQIWNSFYQVDTESNGNGLGLAIVKSIVGLHNGSCRAFVQDEFNCFEIVI